jgi:hypothetical protein
MQRLYFGRDSLLSYDMPPTVDSILVRNAWDPSYSFDRALADGFAGSGFELGVPPDTRVFLTPPLSEDILWVGVPRLHIDVRPTSTCFPLHARICEQDSSGRTVFVNRVNFIARGWVPGLVDTATVDGLAQAHRFSRGSRLRVELTNIDVSNADGWGNAAFVLPLLQRVDAMVMLGGSQGSWIEIPIAGEDVAEVPDEDQPAPDRCQLFPNFPNPFNPSTTIRFALPVRGTAVVTVYNILGEEVARPAEGVYGAGTFSVTWVATNHAAGVYYARLTVGGRSVTRPMVLLR